jgi:dihydroorotase
MNITLRNGRVIDPANQIDRVTDLHIADGKILCLGPAPEGFRAQRVIEADQLVVCPGLVDLSVRLREPGAEHKATIAGEARAAACNGITTICCPPDTDPVIDTPAVAELLQQRAAKQSGLSRVVPLAALTRGLQGTHLAEMGDLKEAGCVGVSNALMPVANTEVLRNAFAYAATCDLTVFHQPREAYLGRGGVMHEGMVSGLLGLTGIPEPAETIEVARCLLLAEVTGVRLHFCRLSTARAVDMVAEAQARGLPISADVAAHQLFLSEHDLGAYDTQCHVYPPLRSRADSERLRQGVYEGTISAICSDHQPHEPDAKLSPFAMTEPGMSTLDTLLPLSLRLAEEAGLSRIIASLTWQPARCLGLSAGTLAPGVAADVCLFDPRRRWRASAETLHSQRHNTPFLGHEFHGRVSHTLIAGQLVYQAEQRG